MATINAIDSGNPIESSRGGTGVNNGASTFTMGGSTSFVGAFTFAGTVTGNTAVTFPTSGTLATTSTANVVGPGTSTDRAIATWNGTGGNALFDNPGMTISSSGDLNIVRSNSGGTVFATLSNTSNTASSDCRVAIYSGGASAGDPYVYYEINGVQAWNHGIDNSDSDKWKLCFGPTLGTNDTIVATTTGQVTMPLKSAFGYYNGGSVRSNVTGDGTSYILIFDTAFSGFTQQGTAWDGTSTFTAPVTGVYHFDLSVRFTGITAQTSGYIVITNVAVQAYYGQLVLPSAVATTGNMSLVQSLTLKLTAGQTVQASTVFAGSTKTVSIDNAAADTYFCGYLVC